MNLSDNRILAILGYIIVVNDEMHSRQVELLNMIIKKNRWGEEEKEIIYDVLNDKDEKVTYNEAISLFGIENVSNRLCLYRYAYQLAIVNHDSFKDKFIDTEEKKILESMEGYLDKRNFSKEKRKALKEIDIYINKKQKSKTRTTFNLDFRNLEKLAKQDFKTMEEVVEEILKECISLNEKMENSNVVNDEELGKILQKFKQDFKQEVVGVLEGLKSELPKKELASQQFSIALMGRTKAGKSTLHSIMCREGEEFIGKGGQRTTRFNRVFSWEGIEIIDTPGIGAGESSGKKDEEIAKKVISRADIICFVIADDSITSEILETINDIASYHKPIVILLNHKDDINKKSHRKKFEKNPKQWLEDNGEKNLQGWIERIKRNAEKNRYVEMIKIVPVFLLATIVGRKENNPLIFQASNFKQFESLLKKMIEENYTIYKSQTLLDEPAVKMYKSMDTIDDELKMLDKFQKKWTKLRNEKEKSIQKLQDKTKGQITKIIDGMFDNFFTQEAENYVKQNYNVKSTIQLQKAYEQTRNKYKLYEKIESEVHLCLNSYHNELSDIIKELKKEIHYANINITEEIEFKDIKWLKNDKSMIPIKGILEGASMALQALGCIYRPLSLIAIPISFISSFFKSKEQKIEEAKGITRKNFQKLIEYDKQHLRKKVEKNEVVIFEENTKKLVSFLEGVDKTTKQTKEYVEDCYDVFYRGLKYLDASFALRILQYISNNPEIKRLSAKNIKTKRRRLVDDKTFFIEIERGKNFNANKIKELLGINVKIIRGEK